MRYLILIFTSLFLLACSSNEDKPNELKDLVQKVSIQERWSKSVGSGLSDVYRIIAPVIDGDTIYANDYKGRVFAFDRETGKRQWTKATKVEVASGVGVGGDKVFIASLNGDVIALDDESGEELWKANITSEVLAPPQTNGAVVVVQTNDGKVIGLDANNGEEIWRFTAQLPILTIRGTASPQVFGPNVVTGFANGKLVALSAVDGTLFWERRIARPQGRSDIERVVDIDGTPVISNQLIFSTSYNGSLTAITPRGDILWSQSSSSYSSPVVIDERVFVSSSEGWMRAFDVESGALLWENKLLSGRKLAAPQNLAGFIVTADFEGFVHVFDPESGSILDRFQVDNDGVRSPMVTDGTHLYVLGNDGVLSSIAVYLFKS
jgi:outer membrane protein assembly factor BamB